MYIPTTIIGGGVIGTALAYALSRRTNKEIVLLERNKSFRQGENQSSRSSGVIHAGVYYDKRIQPLKASLCVEGNQKMYAFCEEFNIPHKRTGKLIVATDEREERYLDDVLRMAEENRVPSVRKITGEEARMHEPNVTASAALYVPTSGIIDAAALVYKLATLAENNGAYLMSDSAVQQITPRGNRFVVNMIAGGEKTTFETDRIFNCAGLYADVIARMVNPDAPYQIVPARGEAAKFYNTKRAEISMSGMNVYPAPYCCYNDTGEVAEVPLEEAKRMLQEGKVTKTVGIHLTPTLEEKDGIHVVGKTVTIGPAKNVDYGKEDYAMGLRKEAYYHERVQRFFPGIQREDIELHQVGIMAVLKGHKDWVIEPDEKYPTCVNLVGIDSPGLTSALAIADYVTEMVNEEVKLCA